MHPQVNTDPLLSVTSQRATQVRPRRRRLSCLDGGGVERRGDGYQDKIGSEMIGVPSPEGRMGVWGSGLLKGRCWLEGGGEGGIRGTGSGWMRGRARYDAPYLRPSIRQRAGTSGRCSRVVSRVWADERQQHQSARIGFFVCKSPSPDPPFGRLLTWRPKREDGSLGPLDWPAARVSCFDVLVWLPSAVRHGAEGGETCAIRTGIGTWLGEGGRGVVVSYRSE